MNKIARRTFSLKTENAFGGFDYTLDGQNIIRTYRESDTRYLVRFTNKHLLAWKVEFDCNTPERIVEGAVEAALGEIGIHFTFDRNGQRRLVTIPQD